MKRNRKKRFLIVLSIIVLPVLVIKTSFEINSVIFEKRINKMNIESVHKATLIEHKILEMDASDIHYYVSGKDTSEVIVFLHPAFSDHRAFAQQIDFFSKKYRVITIDLIGHGLSKTKKSKDKIDASSIHIERILKIEGFEKVHLVGVSMGALIAQYFALNNGEKTKSLTALGGYDINKENKEVVKAQRSSNLSLILRAIFSMKSLRNKISELTCKTEKGKVLFYETTSQYERNSLMLMKGLQNVIMDRKNINPKYPTLILTGEFDLDLAKKIAKEWHSELENSECLMIENAGHCANIDNPLSFNELVDQFIQKTNNN